MSDNEDDDIAMEEEDQDSPQASAGNVVSYSTSSNYSLISECNWCICSFLSSVELAT